MYISEILSNICIELGSFKEAEYYLVSAISRAFPSYGPMTGPHATILANVEPAYLKLQLARALVLLKSFWFDKGLELLQAIEFYKDKLNSVDATTLLEAMALVCFFFKNFLIT